MLFDLTSTRRRRTAVKIIYATLAVLMVVGLVLLGVGTGSGGILDSGNGGGNSGGGGGDGPQRSAVKSAQAKVTANPKSPTAYVGLIAADWSLANATSNYNSTSYEYTAAGQAALEHLITAWKTYSGLTKNLDEDTVLRAAYAMDRVGDFSDGAVVWQNVIAVAGSSTKSYECLAADAYAAKNTTLGDQAAAKVLSLTPKIDRTQTQDDLIDKLKTVAGAKSFSAGSAGQPGYC